MTITHEGNPGVPTTLSEIQLQMRRLAVKGHLTAPEAAELDALRKASRALHQSDRRTASRSVRQPSIAEARAASGQYDPSNIVSVQAEIRRLTAKGNGRTLNEDGFLRTLHGVAAKLNAERSRADDQVAQRATEKLRASRATRVETIDVLHATRNELRDAALTVLERGGRHLEPHQADVIDGLIRHSDEYVNNVTIARRLIVTERPAYRSAFRKALDPNYNPTVWTTEESAAVNEYRAVAEGTGSSGGFGLPVLIDPTIIPSAGENAVPILQAATSIIVTTDAWKGVTTAGPSWGWKGEAAAASDDTPTLAQPSIPTYTANGYIPFSFQLGQDYPGWAAEAQATLSQGYVDMMASATVNGTGSSQPFGIFPRMVGVTTSPSHIVVTTSGTMGAVDVRKAWQSLPQRWRSNATWIAHPSVETLAKNFAGANAEVDYKSTLRDDGTSVSALEGRPLVITDYAPAYTGSTAGTYAYAVVGDFRGGFRVIHRAGLEVELVRNVPNLPSSGVPIGQSAWYATARLGWDVVVPDAFRIIANA